jgi:2-hydroxychromene-2-carboxylate isomerase
MSPSGKPPWLDFFYFIGSTYTYLTVSRIAECASRAGLSVRWRPFSVRTIMTDQNNIPFRDKPAKSAYMWRDIERRAARHGIGFTPIPPYPVDPEELANRVAVVASLDGWCPEYTVATYRAWFLEHKAPGDPRHLPALLAGLGQDPVATIRRANTQEIRDKYALETQAARTLGIFGSPTFVSGAEIFWGDDRLEDAIDWTQSHASDHTEVK